MNFSPWQQQVFDSAVQAHGQGRLGHALLLVGPAHLGKHAVAEALANRLLCAEPRSDGFACGQCRSCRMFPAQTIGLVTTQAHADLQRVGLEPNEKGDKLRSEITVEQIRRLGQWFSLTAQFGGAQVAIIEPADLMNISASNALLKTLEEPSPNRFLLIVSSRPGRLPATIRSRCQRLEFRIPHADAAAAWLRQRGFSDGQIGPALTAARGNPGLAEQWLGNGGLQLRSEVLEQLEAVGAGRADAVATGQRWMADDSAELRLRFVADLALEAAAGRWQAAPTTARRLTAPGDFLRLCNWFDSVNRARDQLRAPLRHDLVVAGLLHEWRNMVQ